mmetsp:Transcript_44102/g.50877  ORF Transcript_44102/g.50877 Transcript_44102/m.50877 type:complete len:107 (+) Transcript_44102:541-861(+)
MNAMQSIQIRQESCDIEPFISKLRTSHYSTAITDVTLGLSFERVMSCTSFVTDVSQIFAHIQQQKSIYSIPFHHPISHPSNLCACVRVSSKLTAIFVTLLSTQRPQ